MVNVYIIAYRFGGELEGIIVGGDEGRGAGAWN